MVGGEREGRIRLALLLSWWWVVEERRDQLGSISFAFLASFKAVSLSGSKPQKTRCCSDSFPPKSSSRSSRKTGSRVDEKKGEGRMKVGREEAATEVLIRIGSFLPFSSAITALSREVPSKVQQRDFLSREDRCLQILIISIRIFGERGRFSPL